MGFGLELEIGGKDTLSPKLGKARDEYGRFVAQAAQGSDKLRAATIRTSQAHETLRQRMSSAFGSVRTAVNNSVSAIVQRLKSMADASSQSADKVAAASLRMAGASEALQRRAVTAWKAIQVAIVAAAAASTIAGASFEQAMARVGATTSATPAQMAQLSAAARSWGASTTFGAKQVAQAMAVVADSSGDAAETLQTIGPVVKFAGATMIDLAEGADLVAQALDAFGLKGQDADRIVNVMAASIGKIDMNSLRAGLANVAAMAGNVGLSFEETIAMLALLDQGGQKATKSAAGLQGIFSALLNPSEELTAMLGGMTIQGDGVVAVFQRLASQGSAALSKAFDARQLSIILSLAKQGPAAFDKMTASITGTARAEEMFARNQATVASQMLVLKNMVGEVMIAAFQEMSGVVLTSVKDVQAFVERYKAVVVGLVITIRDWTMAHRDQVVSGLKAAGVVAVLLLTVGSFLKVMATMVTVVHGAAAAKTIWMVSMSKLAPVISMVTGLIMRMTLAIAASPAGWIILAVAAAAALGAIAVHLYKTDERFRNFVDQLLRGAKLFGKAFFDILTLPVRRMVEFWDKALSFVGELFPGLEEKVRGAMAFIGEKAGDVWEGIGNGAEQAFDWAKMKAADARDAIGDAAEGMKAKFANAFGGMQLDSGAFFADLEKKGKEALARQAGTLTPPPDSPAAAAGELPTPDNAGFARALAQREDAWRAHLILMAAAPKPYDEQWLSEREAMIRRSYDNQIALAGGSAAAIGALEIRRDQEITAAKKAGTTEWLSAHEALINANYARELVTADGSVSKIAELTIQRDQQLQDVLVASNAARLARVEDQEKASLMRLVSLYPTYTKEWLAARQAQINAAYAVEEASAGGSAAKIAELQIARSADLSTARQVFEDEVLAHWLANNQIMMLGISSLEAAYDTFFDTILDKEMTGKQRREAMWDSSKRTFIRNASQMFKAYVVEQIKATIIGQALNEKVAARQKFLDAKIGAVKAFHAFAAIPIIGPALGAAAAAAAFAFLMAFNKGGLVPGGGPDRDSIPAVLTPGEFVMRRETVQKVGSNALASINRTGQLPQTGNGLTVNFNISGGDNVFARDMKAFLHDVIYPQIEEAMSSGRIRGKLAEAR
jgi:TP901 family phage tail tape measure protein